MLEVYCNPSSILGTLVQGCKRDRKWKICSDNFRNRDNTSRS